MFGWMSETELERSILLVEDDPALALGLSDSLRFEGYRVVHTSKGEEAIELARSEGINCVILDLMLPDMNGYQVCETIRANDPILPILMLTARSQEADKIRGLEAGADDYVTKPFSIGELVARIRALFRRAGRAVRPSAAEIQIGDLNIGTVAQTLTRGSETTHLSFYEVELLKFLWERRGEPVSRDEILEKIWGLEAGPNNRTVDNFIVKLRRKIEPKPDRPVHILTVYGVGYKLVC
jgi:DNA-binding response OmpR family regulator